MLGWGRKAGRQMDRVGHGGKGISQVSHDVCPRYWAMAWLRLIKMPVWQAKEYVDILFDIIIDRLSDNDNVEIRLYNGLTITTNFLPSKENHLTNITTGKDKMIKVGLKVSRKLKTLLYEMNKDKEKEHSASQSSTNK